MVGRGEKKKGCELEFICQRLHANYELVLNEPYTKKNKFKKPTTVA